MSNKVNRFKRVVRKKYPDAYAERIDNLIFVFTGMTDNEFVGIGESHSKAWLKALNTVNNANID